jgi:hypothetical protein
MTLGILVYFVFRAGFITPTARDAINPFGFIAVSALVGLFAEQAMHRFKTVAEAVFQRPDAGPDSTQGTASQPNPSRPQAATTNAPRSLPVPTTQPRFQDGSA